MFQDTRVVEGTFHSFDRRLDFLSREAECQDSLNDYLSSQLADLSVEVITLKKDYQHILTEHLIPLQSGRGACECTGVLPSPINPSHTFPSRRKSMYPLIRGLTSLSTIRPENPTLSSSPPPLHIKPPIPSSHIFSRQPSSSSSLPPLEEKSPSSGGDKEEGKEGSVPVSEEDWVSAGEEGDGEGESSPSPSEHGEESWSGWGERSVRGGEL